MKQTRAKNPDEIDEEPDDPNALSEKQERALQAVLSHPTLKEAALAAGISETTLWRYMQDEEFSRRLREARRDALSHAVTRLQQAAGEAVTVLHDLMIKNDVPPAARRSAASTILDYAFRADEHENLKGRIEELEKRILRKQEEDALDRGRKASGGGAAGEDEG